MTKRRQEQNKRITARMKEEYVKEVALDCVANMAESDKEYLRDNPNVFEQHFGYALYIRNHYFAGDDYDLICSWGHPDDLSGEIMEYIFSLLLPDEYLYNDRFTRLLFNYFPEFIPARKDYKERYGQYPVGLISKYKAKADCPEDEITIPRKSKSEILERYSFLESNDIDSEHTGTVLLCSGY